MTRIIKKIEKILLENLGKLSFIISISSFGIKSQLISTIFLLIILNLAKKTNLMSFSTRIFKKFKNIIFKNNSNKEKDEEKDEEKDQEKYEDKHEDKDEHTEKKEQEENNNKKILDNLVKSETTIDKNNKIKNNIKLICTKIDQEELKKKIKINPYENDIKKLEKKYKASPNNHDFTVNINSSTCTIPIFNMRTYEGLDFHYNFLIHDFDTKKINNLIMCKDINKWMSTPSLSNEDLMDELVPLYFIKKKDGKTEVYEYLKIFIHRDNNDSKIAFTQKGDDYIIIKDDINKLIEKELIKDMLVDKHYTNYNLSNNNDVTSFLENLLSLFLIDEKFIGDKLQFDIENFNDNKRTYDFHFHTLHSDCSMFNTSI